MGDLGQFIVPIAAAGMSLYLNDPQGLKEFVISSAVIMSTTHSVKHTINRKRPDKGNCSFPSGHTASAFMGATYISRRYGMQYAFPYYIAAGYVGFSRVYAKKHYISDVMASIGLCIVVNHFLITPRYQHVQVCPFLDRNTFGLAISCPIGG